MNNLNAISEKVAEEIATQVTEKGLAATFNVPISGQALSNIFVCFTTSGQDFA